MLYNKKNGRIKKMNTNLVVLQNAKAQLEAQKKKIYADAYASAIADKKAEIDEFKSNKQTAYAAKLEELKKAYDEALNEMKKNLDEEVANKTAEVDAIAENFANMKVSETDNLIKQIEQLINGLNV